MNPLVSAIIPVYNGKKFLSDAVDSILKQNYNPIEIIIVDDGSTDGTAEIKNGFSNQVQYIYQDNKGPASARNKGITAARGEFVAFLDSDDLWPDNKLNTQTNYLIQNPQLEVILGHTKVFTSELTGKENSLISVQLGSILFRKSVFEAVGNFDEKLKFSEDHDWFLRAREKKTKMLVINEITLYHRRHTNNMTKNDRQTKYQLTTILKKSLDRRRQNDGIIYPLPSLSDYLKKNN